MKATLAPADVTLPKLLTSRELQAYLRASRGTAERFGKACGAERRVGRKLLFDLATINAAMEERAGGKE